MGVYVTKNRPFYVCRWKGDDPADWSKWTDQSRKSLLGTHAEPLMRAFKKNEHSYKFVFNRSQWRDTNAAITYGNLWPSMVREYAPGCYTLLTPTMLQKAVAEDLLSEDLDHAPLASYYNGHYGVPPIEVIERDFDVICTLLFGTLDNE